MNKRSLLATPYIVWIIGFTVLPILMIVFYALGDGNGGFTLSNILAIFEPVHLKSLLLALWLALLCTVVCLLLAYPLAVILRKLNIGKKGLMAIIVILPMWVNFVLRIMAWQLLLSRNGIINAILGVLGLPGQDLANSNVAIVIGMVYDYLPFMILPVYNAVMELNEDVIEAARMPAKSSDSTVVFGEFATFQGRTGSSAPTNLPGKFSVLCRLSGMPRGRGQT